MKAAMHMAIFATIVVVMLNSAYAKNPDCTGTERWPASMAFVHLKNAGMTDNYRIDFSKTRVVRLASEKIGKDLYRQVHRVTFTEKAGDVIEVITLNDASSEECSMSGVQVFVVSKRLGVEAVHAGGPAKHSSP
jgi:hypothetical protein